MLAKIKKMDVKRFPMNSCLNTQILGSYVFSENPRIFYHQIFHEQVEGKMTRKSLLFELII